MLKMDQKVMQILLILLFYPKVLPAHEVEEGKEEKISCKPSKEGATIVFWFRALDNSGMEFIGSFAPAGPVKTAGPDYNKNLIVNKVNSDFVLTVKSFRKTRDSGTYICAGLVKGNELIFGQVAELQGKSKPPTNPPAIQVSSTTTTQTTTPTSCICKEKSGPSMFCAPIILGPLAGGCGLLLLLLIITILYCNKIRTRRCPHHYKKKMRMMAPEKQMTNRHF